MNRGIILGAIAFAAAFFAERQFEVVKKDIERYDRLRAMSGEPPLYKQLGTQLAGMVTTFGSQRQDEAKNLFTSLTGDLVRYARIRAM